MALSDKELWDQATRKPTDPIVTYSGYTVEMVAPLQPQEQHMTGRPTQYDPDTAHMICERLSDGQSLRTVCKADDMPAMSTVFKWLSQQESFVEQYARATSERAEAMIEDMQALADDETLDHNSRRIRVDTRKWIASKLKPKKYGEKVQLSGDDEGAPIVVTWAKPTP